MDTYRVNLVILQLPRARMCLCNNSLGHRCKVSMILSGVRSRSEITTSACLRLLPPSFRPSSSAPDKASKMKDEGKFRPFSSTIFDSLGNGVMDCLAHSLISNCTYYHLQLSIELPRPMDFMLLADLLRTSSLEPTVHASRVRHIMSNGKLSFLSGPFMKPQLA